jgi:toxin ParE1/3/4
MDLAFHPEALAELRAAVDRLNEERPGHGPLCANKRRAKARVAQARRFPRSGPAVSGMPEANDVRRFGLIRFHYQIVTAHIAGDLVVVAFAHESREPGYWKARLGG